MTFFLYINALANVSINTATHKEDMMRVRYRLYWLFHHHYFGALVVQAAASVKLLSPLVLV